MPLAILVVARHAIGQDQFSSSSLPDASACEQIDGEILRIADDAAADVTVTAFRRPDMKDCLLGDNAARVVRHARVSFLIVRE